ncbi:MAG: hypothetical protein QNJ46_08595 [Leptolyngbyaceae cyanobacterium MO_188.B28]|nr:hypothetical protein [Leptolyngbyaceae cyanobacterium MO_188.B28]
MTNFYKNMLNLEVWHDFALDPEDPFVLPDRYDISKSVSLVPTSDCQQVLSKLRWFFRPKPSGGTLIAYVDKVDTDVFKTQVPINSPDRLTFWLVVHDDYFANFTNIPLTTNRNQIYYFSNLYDSWRGDSLFLTKSLTRYKDGGEYHLGDLVVLAQGQTLEALQYLPSAPSSPNPDHWNVCPNSPYVSALDLMARQGLSYPYTLPNLNPGDKVKFNLVDANGKRTWDAEIVAPKEHVPGDDLVGSLNFTGQSPGRYQLYQAEQAVTMFVLADPLTANAAFALVELVLNPNQGSPGFELTQIKTHQPLQEANQTYAIRFKNRSTRWRYRHQTDHGFCVPDAPPAPPDEPPCVPIDEQFVVFDAKTYATKRPQSLLRQPKKLLNNGKKVLPAPNGSLIKPILEPARPPLPEHIATIFSDVHI